MDLINLETRQKNIQHDLSLELKFSKQIKSILGNQFIVKDVEEDLHYGTDFLILRIKPFRLAARLRRFNFFQRYDFKNQMLYRKQFTIRWERPSGVDTEIHKIRSGFVDFLFYGFVDKTETKIIQYFIGDLNIFRILNVNPLGIFPNDPPDSLLGVFGFNQFQKDFFIKMWP